MLKFHASLTRVTISPFKNVYCSNFINLMECTYYKFVQRWSTVCNTLVSTPHLESPNKTTRAITGPTGNRRPIRDCLSPCLVTSLQAFTHKLIVNISLQTITFTQVRLDIHPAGYQITYQTMILMHYISFIWYFLYIFYNTEIQGL